MTCEIAEEYLSALYDGEGVPAGVVEHTATCAECRAVLQDYAQMGAEIKVAAALESVALPRLELPAKKQRLGFLWRRVMIPRYVLAGLLAMLVALPVGVSLLRAQSKPLWFEFGTTMTSGEDVSPDQIGKIGFDKVQSVLYAQDGKQLAAALRVKIESITDGEAVLRCRAIPTSATPEGQMYGLKKNNIPLDTGTVFHYKPGETLAIPIDGQGFFYLKGQIFDHQPKIAFLFPLEVPDNKMIVRSPIIVKGDQLLGDLSGASVIATNREAVQVQAGSNGRFLFALRQFPGAVKGEAEWGQIKFELDGEKYRLVSPAPITGGDQPESVWVRRDPSDGDRSLLGGGPIPQ